MSVGVVVVVVVYVGDIDVGVCEVAVDVVVDYVVDVTVNVVYTWLLWYRG